MTSDASIFGIMLLKNVDGPSVELAAAPVSFLTHGHCQRMNCYNRLAEKSLMLRVFLVTTMQSSAFMEFVDMKQPRPWPSGELRKPGLL